MRASRQRRAGPLSVLTGPLEAGSRELGAGSQELGAGSRDRTGSREAREIRVLNHWAAGLRSRLLPKGCEVAKSRRGSLRGRSPLKNSRGSGGRSPPEFRGSGGRSPPEFRGSGGRSPPEFRGCGGRSPPRARARVPYGAQGHLMIFKGFLYVSTRGAFWCLAFSLVLISCLCEGVRCSVWL